ncbi:hypothetical protein ACJROX_10845 [Pseudalkalibacillus sp. A8]|uniref:hypothetical protein n=1 Tax=Pseudalkalibacillus sp. A8 TaxID=3382641 RepID=UPI0038B5CC48
METTYKQNQAFERAHKVALENPDHNKWDTRERELLFTKNPEKLKDFIHYVPYMVWFQELFSASQLLIKKLQEINNDMENAKTNFMGLFGKTKKINSHFDSLHSLTDELNNFRADCSEFQQCILASQIHNNTDYSDILQEQTRYLDLIESKIRQTGDRKLASINNSRMQTIGLILSLTAISISVYSVLISN